MSLARVWPTELLKPGESFLFPEEKYDSALQTTYRMQHRFPGRRFITVRLGNGMGRLWRVDGIAISKPKIEKNVPIPQREHVGLFPFKEMEVGDSFVIHDASLHKCVVEQASRYKRKRVAEFTTRKIADGKWRCWRIK